MAQGTTRWWPPSHSVSAAPGLTVTFEPRPGGGIYERTPDGAGAREWGEVVAWEPPHRLVYLWHLRFDRSGATEVEVTFAPHEAGTAVTIVHRGWERLDPWRGATERRPVQAGAVAEERRERNRRGWAGAIEHYVRQASRDR